MGLDEDFVDNTLSCRLTPISQRNEIRSRKLIASASDLVGWVLVLIYSEAALGRIFVCRLDYGADFLDSVRRFADEKGIGSAVFTALGAFERVALAFYDQTAKKYTIEKIERPIELLSCVGNIGKLIGKTIVHSHAVVSDSEDRVYGGHLAEESIVFACELVISELQGINLGREYDKETGLNLFTFR